MRTEYQKLRNKFAIRGLQLARPSDLLEENKYAVLDDVRSYVDGLIVQRPGLTLLYDTGAASPVHSIKRLNDPVNARSAYITGAGTKLYSDDSGHTAATEIDSGYSNGPLCIVTHRPDQSPLPFAYISDSLRMRKCKSTAAGDTFKSFPIGISPPLVPPTVTLDPPLIKVVDEFEATAGWTAGGDAGAPSLEVGKRVDTTITYILFDSGTTGNACVNPATLSAQLQAGMRLTVSGATEVVTVEDVFPAIASTTISSIQYDAGATGLCTIVLAAPSATLVKDAMVRLAAAENVRVISVTTGPGGATSFRCSTTGTRLAGDAVAGLASFRAYFINTHAAADTLTDEAVESAITYATGTATLTKASALDLSISGTRPIKDDDYMVVSFRASLPALITEVKFQLDVADVTNDFTKDFFEKSFRAADLTSAVKGTTPTLTAQQRAAQRRQVDVISRYPRGLAREEMMLDRSDALDAGFGIEPIDTDTQLGLGDNVWTTLQWKLKDMTRVGQDRSRGLRNVAAIRVTVICTGSLTIDVDAWYVKGGYELDVQSAYWAFRYRSLETKARSLMSPPTRSPLTVERGSVTVNCVTKDTTVAGDPQVTAIDVYRFDDMLEDWSLVGTVANPTNAAATTANFTDAFSDEYVKDNPLAEFDQFQPWPIPDQPRSGTCDVKGTEVTRLSGDNFNTAWGRGSRPLKINGTPCTLYTSPTSANQLSLTENLGTLSNVKWEFAEPLLLGQPRAILWGPYGAGSSGIFFFSVDGGCLLWTNPNNPDAASDRNRLEITSPSEPLINGFMYDGRPYVFSTERLFAVYPNFGGASDFVAQEVANCKGLFAQWGLCVADGGLVYWVGKDGLYESEGGESRLISTDLLPLFPHDGTPGVDTGGYSAPAFTSPDFLRLSHSDNRVKFTYQDGAAVFNSFVWNTVIRGYESRDTYTPQITVFYAEEGDGVHGELAGGNDGKLYRVGGADDAGVAVTSHLRTKAEDAGEFARKTFGDVQIDLKGDADIAAFADNYNTAITVAPAALSAATRKPIIVDFNSGDGSLAHNVGLDLTWTTPGTQLYEYILSYLLRPDESLRRFSNWDDIGSIGAKYFQGIRIVADTRDAAGTAQDRTIEIRYISEAGLDTLGATLTCNHNGLVTRDYSFDVPFYAYRVRIVPTDTDQWMLEDWKFDAQPASELGLNWETPETTHGFHGYFHIKELWLPHISTADLTLKVYVDGVLAGTYTIANNAGAFKKSRVILAAVKGKSVKYALTSAEKARINIQDLEALAKPWGSTEPYQIQRAFGGPSYQQGAEI